MRGKKRVSSHIAWPLTAMIAIVVTGAFFSTHAQAAAPTWGKCPEKGLKNLKGVQCAYLNVALDRSGSVPGTVKLRVARKIGKKGRPWTVFLSGGPGQAGVTTFFETYGQLDELKNENFILLDQRGTGRSGALDCGRPPDTRDIGQRSAYEKRCASKLGPKRAFYTTRDVVDDIEQIRNELNLGKVNLLGVSYGTGVALTYARTHPTATGRLILDAVVDPDESGWQQQEVFAALRSTLKTSCRGQCRALLGDPITNLQRLGQILNARPHRGFAFSESGKRERVAVRAQDLLGIALDGDLSPNMRSLLALATKSALHGDFAPLRRLALISKQSDVLETSDPSSLSYPRYLCTVCEESNQVWSRDTPVDQRIGLMQGELNKVNGAIFAPFDAKTLGVLADCTGWQATRNDARLPNRPYPAVPTMLIQGRDDARTHPAASARVASKITGAQRVVVDEAAHAMSLFVNSCARKQLGNFLNGRPVAKSCKAENMASLLHYQIAPRSIAKLKPLPGAPTKAIGRTVRAVQLTLKDMSNMVFTAAMGDGVGGLHGGFMKIKMDAQRLILRDFSYIPGVKLSTNRKLMAKKTTIRVSGKQAAKGTVIVNKDNLHMSGQLNGKRFSCTEKRCRRL